MPYPTCDNPHYCEGSDRRPVGFDSTLHWQRCEVCGRPIVAKASGRLHPHLDHPTRRRDEVQERLIAMGLNTRERRGGREPMVYAEPEVHSEPEAG